MLRKSLTACRLGPACACGALARVGSRACVKCISRVRQLPVSRSAGGCDEVPALRQ
jgi:hypothetical protein